LLNLSLNAVFATDPPSKTDKMEAELKKVGESFTISGLFGVGDIAAKAIGNLVGGIGYILGFITSVIFTLGGWLVTFALNINLKLLESPMVETGWKVVLNFTNLGFVLAIIIIAFATIFRVQSYAMKQTLWKLIVAALLVNFSLMIAGAFINVSDLMANFFLEQATLKGGGVAKFSELLAGTLGVQSFLEVKDAGDFAGAINAFGTSLLTIIASVFLVAGFTLIGAITLLAVAIMLIIRYVFLGILLILSPIVWLLWIFPATSGYWQSWWKHFIRWTFFAPLVLFFLSLSVITQSDLGKLHKDNLIETTKTMSATMDVNKPFTFGFEAIGNLVIVLGLMVGGLIAANSLGIAFAGTAYGWAQGIGKSFGGWVGRKGLQVGTALPRSGWGRRQIEKIEKFGVTGKEGLGWRMLQTATKPIRDQVGGRLGKLAAAGAEKAVASAGKKLDGYDDGRLAKMIYTLDAPEQVAALQRLRKNKTLDLLERPADFVNKKIEELFVKYGQSPTDFKNLTRTMGFDRKMYEAAKVALEKKDPESLKLFQEAADKHYGNMRPEHFSKMELDEFFGIKDDFKLGDRREIMQKGAVAAALKTNPDGLHNIYAGLKGENLDNFHRMLTEQLRREAGEQNMRAFVKKNHPRLYILFNSPGARSRGIILEGVTQEEGKRVKRKINQR